MAMPKSVVRFKKDGIEYISSVDKCEYTIRELTRAALRDVGKFVCRKCNSNAYKLWKGLRQNGRMSNRIKGRKSTFQYWARSKECDLIVGVKHGTWYGTDQELGTSNQPKKAILRTAVERNIPTIVEIESKYLSALESEAEALKMIESEDDYEGGADDEG